MAAHAGPSVAECALSAGERVSRFDGGMRGGHKRALRGPRRRNCTACGGLFIGRFPECSICRDKALRPLLVQRRTDDDPPPRAA